MNKFITVAILCFFALSFFGCSNSEEKILTANIDAESLVEINKYLATRDFDIMRHFVKRKSWEMSFSDDGYFYEIFEAGDSPKITDKKQVLCDYTITLLDGTICYKITNKAFVVGGSEEIAGLHHSIKHVGKGGKARFIFPSNLAHGLQGDFNKIPPRAVLIYNVQVNDVLN